MNNSKVSHIFVSYSHEDESWLNRLLLMLKPATRNRTVRVWVDTQIKPGAKWRDEIYEALDQASVAVLLVSANFLVSEFITTDEFPYFLKAAEKRGLRILWIPISECLFEMTEIAAYQAVSSPSKPIDALNLAEANRALAEIARKIIATAEELELQEENGGRPVAQAELSPISLEGKLWKAPEMPVRARLSLGSVRTRWACSRQVATRCCELDT